MFWNNKTSREPTAPAVARPRVKPTATATATAPAPASISASAPKSFGLSLDIESLKPTKPERNSDPYNTSGSFDRTKHWARVSKR